MTSYFPGKFQSCLIVWLLAALLAGCNRPPAAAIESAQWQICYQRPGWQGEDTVDLRAVGDIMAGRFVARVARARGYTYPLAQIGASGSTPLLLGDVVLGNLESPLTDHPAPLRRGPYRLPAPTDFAEPLAAAGFDLLSLANNHALDAGPDGLQESVRVLTAAGIQPLGAGPDRRAAARPVWQEVDGLRIAFLAFNEVADPEDEPDEGEHWGRAWLHEDALESVRQASQQGDLVVVLVHWGQEYEARPSEQQRTRASELLAAGADVIIGAHPHVLQPVEIAARGDHTTLTAYSLGNFLFDQPFSAETSTGAVLRLLLDQHGVALAAVAPVAIVQGQTRSLPLHSTEAQRALLSLGICSGGQAE